MNREFAKLMKSVHSSFKRLVKTKPLKAREIPKSIKGVYLFTEKGRPQYAGRGKVRERVTNHCRSSSGQTVANFAFKLARRMTGNRVPSYKAAGSRKDLCKNPKFAKAFKKAKERISKMDVHYVQEHEPKKQALLEIYTAIALKTPFNRFETT